MIKDNTSSVNKIDTRARLFGCELVEVGLSPVVLGRGREGSCLMTQFFVGICCIRLNN